jgi:excisionase family DNA binding protein
MTLEPRDAMTRPLVSPVGGIYTTDEAADLLRTSKRTVQRLIREGKLGANRVGHGYRILDKHIQAFFAQQETPSPPLRTVRPTSWVGIVPPIPNVTRPP